MLDVKPTGQRGRTATGPEVVETGDGISFRHHRRDTDLLSYKDRM